MCEQLGSWVLEKPRSFYSVPSAPSTDRLNRVSLREGRTFRRLRFLFSEQAKRVNLKSRGNKPIKTLGVLWAVGRSNQSILRK